MGALTYDVIFSTRSSFTRMRTCLLSFYRKDEDPESAEQELRDAEEAKKRRKRKEREDDTTAADGEETFDLNSPDPRTSLDEEGGLEPRQGMSESEV